MDICCTMLLPFFQDELTEAGLDEAGRGCYAGPVFAAAVILPTDFSHPVLNDSKQLTEKERDRLRPIIERECIAFAVHSCTNQEIDKYNILGATYRAMYKCIDKLAVSPGLLLVDGNRFKPYKRIPYRTIIKGDGIYSSIAAASVLAKTYRDDYMKQLHEEYPQYGWHNNKGYGTEVHRQAIEQHGLCKYHRKSFKILPDGNGLF